MTTLEENAFESGMVLLNKLRWLTSVEFCFEPGERKRTARSVAAYQRGSQRRRNKQ